MRRFLFSVFLVVACATGAAAGPIEEAVSAYQHGDYALAEQLIRPLAEQGNAEAQFRLGIMHQLGKGVPQDYREAVKWYRKAADQGDAQGQFSLGVMYRSGVGIPQDYQEALKWFRKAADQGEAQAQHNLGVMYENGKGVPQDTKEAVKWFRRSAEHGFAPAQSVLGVLYHNGRGIRQDLLAYMWLTIAAAALSDDARKEAMKNRDHVELQMTAAQIEKAQEMARRCQESKFKECD